ncbi:MAG: hypothetical protein HQ589_05980, partial [Syntrophaceae bacterium]|nr:hypothetical protein [Syntrophaceae bacterium]
MDRAKLPLFPTTHARRWHNIMYIVFPNGKIDDQDMEQLQELLSVLDHQFALNIHNRKKTHVPEQYIYWDRLSYIAGLGFVMCQQYINITYPTDGLEKNNALPLPPMHSSGYSIAQLINAGANYWKHYQEDVNFPYGSLRKTTIEPIEKLGLDIDNPYI